jgi:hypothetical protein
MEVDVSRLKELENQILRLASLEKTSVQDILKALQEREEERNSRIPLSIFDNTKLSALEAIVKFLKEERKLDYRKIANILGRNYDPIAITYRNAKRKMDERLKTKSDVTIPASILHDRRISVLESIASYLKNELNMTYHEIAVSLNRDDRTIWTVCNRAMRKNEQK